MLNNLLNISSLNNLGKKGQIATILILIMMAVFIFVLVTTNIGVDALYATQLANAADSGALLLGAQLATKGRILFEALGNRRKKCKGGHFWRTLFRVVFKTFIGVCMGGFTLYSIFTGAAAFSAALYQESVANRIQQQALKAAAEKMSENMTEPEFFRENVFMNVLIQTIDDPNEVPDFFDQDEDGDTQEMIPYFLFWWDRRVEEYAGKMELLKDAIRDFAKKSDGPLKTFVAALNILDITEEVFLRDIADAEFRTEVTEDGAIVALARLLEEGGYDLTFWEPGPANDDYSTCIEEEEDCGEPPAGYDHVDYLCDELTGFYQWASNGPIGTSVDILAGNLDWVDRLYNTADPNDDTSYYSWFHDDVMPELSAWMVEIVAIRDSLPDADITYDFNLGEVLITNFPSKIYDARHLEFSQELDNIDYFLGNWQVILADSCPETGACSGFTITSIELTAGTISYDYEYTYSGALQTGTGTYDIDSDPVGSGLTIPQVALIADFTLAVNAFRGFVDSIVVPYATVDEDFEDEFEPAISKIDAFFTKVSDFCWGIWGFMHAIYAAVAVEVHLEDWGGENPVLYEWTDSRGDHSMEVEVSEYELASINERTTGGTFSKKFCLELAHEHGHVWVQVKRKDPANKDSGGFLKWNPIAGDSVSTITKTSKVFYDVNKVEVEGTTK